MGGYVDENDKIMTKEELDAWIIKIQEENIRLIEALKEIEKDSWDYNKFGGHAWDRASEALKGGE
jgi:hypothetical protein